MNLEISLLQSGKLTFSPGLVLTKATAAGKIKSTQSDLERLLTKPVSPPGGTSISRKPRAMFADVPVAERKSCDGRRIERATQQTAGIVACQFWFHRCGRCPVSSRTRPPFRDESQLSRKGIQTGASSFLVSQSSRLLSHPRWGRKESPRFRRSFATTTAILFLIAWAKPSRSRAF